MRRRDFLTGILLAMLAFQDAESKAVPKTRLDAETMKAALHTTRIEEEGFIDDVLNLVDKGFVPPDLVESTFQWARRKSRHRFQYFKRGLMVRAEGMDIALLELIAENQSRKRRPLPTQAPPTTPTDFTGSQIPAWKPSP